MSLPGCVVLCFLRGRSFKRASLLYPPKRNFKEKTASLARRTCHTKFAPQQVYQLTRQGQPKTNQAYIWGLTEQTAPFEGSALVEWYYADGAEEPVESVPPNKDGDTHECPRREPAAQEQLRDFLEDGVVNQYCEGVCESLRAEICP